MTTIAERLQLGLKRLKREQSSTSIRGLAQRLKVTPSYLSKVFRGEKPLSLPLAGKLAKALHFDHHQTAEIQRLLLEDIESSKIVTGLRTLKKKRGLSTQYAILGKPDYWLLEEWYHLPLLNLATVEGFDPQTAASRLQITSEQASHSLQRSLQSGYLRETVNGNIEHTDIKVRFPTDRSHESVRKFHRAMIERALNLISGVPNDQDFTERLLSGVAMACNPNAIPQAKLVLEEAIFKAVDILTEGPCTEVFQLNLQLFRLTKRA